MLTLITTLTLTLMSGSFVIKTYQADDYQRYFAIKIQPETLTLGYPGFLNDSAAQNPADYPFVKTRGSRRSIIPIARSVRFRFTGARPPGYAEGVELQLPVLLAFQGSIYTVGKTAQYQGLPIIFTRVIRESIP